MVSTTRILLKKTLRDLRKNWKQFISVILIALLAVCLVVGFLSSAQSLQERVDVVYSKGNISDLWVSTLYDDAQLQEMQNGNDDYNDLLAIQKMEGVELAEGRSVNIGMHGGTPLYSMVVSDDPNDNKLNVPFDIEGEMGFLLEKNYAAAQELKIGDSFVFEFPNTELVRELIAPLLDIFLIDGKSNIFAQSYVVFDFTITGFMSHPECIDNGSVATTYFYTNKSTFKKGLEPLIQENFDINISDEELSNEFYEMLNSFFAGQNQVVLKVKEGADLEQIQENIFHYYQDKPEVKIDKIVDNFVQDISAEIGIPLNSETLINLVNNFIRINNPEFTGIENIEIPRNYLSCLDVHNITTNQAIMSDLVQARQITFVFPVVFFLVAFLIIITTMRQIIIKEKAQIGVMKALGASNAKIQMHYLSFTFILVSLGFLLGCIIGPFLITAVMNQKYGILFNLPALHFSFPWLTVLLFYLAFILVSILIAFFVCRHQIKKLPVESMRQDNVSAKKNRKTKKNEGRVLKTSVFTFKMSIRNIFKSKSRSLMVVLGILGCTALLICGMGIEDTLNNGISRDFDYLYNVDGTLLYNPMLEPPDLYDSDEFKYEVFSQSNATLSHEKSSYQSQIRLIEDDSNVFPIDISPGKIALSQKVADGLNVKSGDTVRFNALNSNFEAEVEEIFEAFYFQGIVARRSDYAGTTLGTMVSGGWIKLSDGVTYDEALEVVEAKDVNGAIATIISRDEFNDMVKEIMKGIELMTNTVRVFALLLAIVVLINISILNYNERARDIATMKVLGLTKTEIGISLVSEIVVLTLVGSLIGCLFGWPLMWAVLYVNQTPLVAFLYKVFPISYVLSVLLTLVTSFVVNLLMVGRTKKIKMVEALKSYE